MTEHTIAKALELWSLQNLLDISIMLGIIALGLSIAQQYYRSLEKYLTLRVSIEIWNVTTRILVDILLLIIVIVGYLTLNPDIMADIKIAVPFVPVAVILFAIAFFLRIFHGGNEISSPNYMKSVWLMFVANVINITGFTFVMEAASGEYLETHPSVFWTFIKTYLRSNADPHGLELSQITFYVCFPILMIVFIWGFKSAISSMLAHKKGA
jgi:hypothetical protein